MSACPKVQFRCDAPAKRNHFFGAKGGGILPEVMGNHISPILKHSNSGYLSIILLQHWE